MNKEIIEVVRGSGNVFRDFDLPNPDLEQLKSILGAQIIGVIEEKHLSVRKRKRSPLARRMREKSAAAMQLRPLHHRPSDVDPQPSRPES